MFGFVEDREANSVGLKLRLKCVALGTQAVRVVKHISNQRGRPIDARNRNLPSNTVHKSRHCWQESNP